MKNLKSKIIFLITFLILTVASAVTFYNLYHEQQENERLLNEAHENVYRTYKETIKDIISYYDSRAETSLKAVGVIEAFRTKDHDTLYTIMRPRWEIMQRENPWLSVMQFHNADGTSLLRLHQPLVYGDNIAAQRSMVAYAHKSGQSIAGFEEGRQGLAFRILVPIFDQGVYIGLVEFGISASYFSDKIHRFAGYDSFFFVNQKALGTFGRIEYLVRIGEHVGIDIPESYRPLLQKYAETYNKLQHSIAIHTNQTYEVNTIQIKDYRSQLLGAIMFIRPTSDFHAHARHMIVASVLIVIMLSLLVGVLVDRIYTFITHKMSFQERYSQTILDVIPSPVIVTDGEYLTAANNSFLEYFNYPNVQSFKNDHLCVCEFFEAGDTDEYLMPLHDDQRWTEYMLDHPLKSHKAKITVNGVSTVFEVRISVLKVNEDTRYVVIFNDISTMQIQTITDPLTGLANRLHFTMVYQHAINIAQRTEKPLGIIFFDIDHFKNINDHFGHLMGDTVLQQIALLVQERTRKSDIVARWGGEEFILLLPDTDLDEAIRVAEMLRKVIDSEHFDQVGHVTCSFGVAILEGNEEGETLLNRADDKLYKAKERGRNKVVF